MSTARSEGAEWLTARRFAALLGLTVFAIWPLVALGQHTFFHRDFGALGYPCGIFLRDCLLRGELPLWNPFSHCGVPFLAQMGMWYPPSWLALALPQPWGVNFVLLLHLIWGGTGMFRLARQWGAGDFTAAFAGFAYVFNGVTLSCLIWGNYVASLAWLPWVVSGMVAAWHGDVRRLVPAALAAALQVLTATPELTLLTWLLLGALWLGEALAGRIKVLSSLGRTVAVVGLAAGITLVQMLPFFDLLAHSQRDRDYGGLVWAMPGWGWANLLMPLFHCYQGPQGTWFQTGQEFLQSYYLGAGVLALGLTGAIFARSGRAAVIAGMILFCWVMALGADGYVYEHVRAVFPLIGIARFPVKFAILPAFLLPLLAAWGIEQILRRENSAARGVYALLAVALVSLLAGLVCFLRAFPFPNDNWAAAAGNAGGRGILLVAMTVGILALSATRSPTARRVVQITLLALLPLDALTHSPRLVPTLPASVLAPGIWQAAGRPALRLGEGRVMLSPAAEQRLNYSAVADFQGDFIGKRVAEWYNLNLLDSLPKVAGAFTLRPADFDVIEQKLYYTPGSRYGAPLLDFLSVRWLTSPTSALEWRERTNFLPVITAGQAPRFVATTEIWPALAADNFDPRAVVYLPESARAAVTVSNRTDCVVSNAHFANNHIAADITAQEPSLVVLSQANYHLWQATVDEQPVKILRANLAFQALQVPAGTHRVRLVYRDPNLALGALISLLSLVVCGVIWWRGDKPAANHP